jgi:hypothetical protein
VILSLVLALVAARAVPPHIVASQWQRVGAGPISAARIRLSVGGSTSSTSSSDAHHLEVISNRGDIASLYHPNVTSAPSSEAVVEWRTGPGGVAGPFSERYADSLYMAAGTARATALQLVATCVQSTGEVTSLSCFQHAHIRIQHC